MFKFEIQLVSNDTKTSEVHDWNVETEIQKAMEGNLGLQVLEQNIEASHQRSKGDNSPSSFRYGPQAPSTQTHTNESAPRNHSKTKHA